MGLRLKKSTIFCMKRKGDDVGLCAPHPHQGVPPWTRFTIGLRLKKSTIFCVQQQERMCYSIPPEALVSLLGVNNPQVPRSRSGSDVKGLRVSPDRI